MTHTPSPCPIGGCAGFLRHLLALLLTLATGTLAQAVVLPTPDVLRARMGTPPQVVRVVEPHLTTRSVTTELDYLGYPAVAALNQILGPDWQRQGDVDVEFRALDGYVSRIPAERFTQFQAWLVFARSDGKPFQVDNLLQNEKQVSLGPYYLVWDNRRSPELIAEGGSFWPYQVAQIQLSRERALALLPGDLATRFAAQARDTQKYCLSCHQVNGFGGDKAPINLAVRARELGADRFLQWVLAPADVKPGTTMPPISPTMAEPERQALARRLWDYLMAVPLKP